MTCTKSVNYTIVDVSGVQFFLPFFTREELSAKIQLLKREEKKLFKDNYLQEGSTLEKATFLSLVNWN